MTEYEANVTEGFRTEAFTADVVDFGVKPVGDYTKVVFEFTDGPDLSLFPPKEITDGNIPGYMALGILINSFTQNGITTFVDVDESTLELDGIRTEPDICGKTVSFEVDTREWINGEGETKTNYDWRIVKVESNDTPAPKPQPDQSPPQNTPETSDEPNESESTDTTKSIDTWSGIVTDVLSEGEATEAQIMKAMKDATPDKQKQAKLNKVRRDALLRLTEDEIIVKDGSKFKLV